MENKNKPFSGMRAGRLYDILGNKSSHLDPVVIEVDGQFYTITQVEGDHDLTTHLTTITLRTQKLEDS